MASTFYFWLVLRRIRSISTDSAHKKGCIKGIGQMHFALTYPGAANIASGRRTSYDQAIRVARYTQKPGRGIRPGNKCSRVSDPREEIRNVQ
jgi:hypothetical protein